MDPTDSLLAPGTAPPHKALGGLAADENRVSGMEQTDICLLGVPEFVGMAEGEVFPSKGFQLLALLALAPSHRMLRRDVASLLWDSESDAAAMTNLRQLLARVRRYPRAAVLIAADHQTVALNGAEGVDLCRFLADGSGEERKSPHALLRFRGDLLEGVVDMSDSFSHWLLRERSHLRDRFFAAASAHLLELTRFGRASSAELRSIEDRMLALDPEREASYRAILEAWGRIGKLDETERVYAALREMVAREHGSPPSPETEAVARRVFAVRARSPVAEPTPAPAPQSRPRIAFLAPRWHVPPAQASLLHALIEDVTNELARYRTFTALAPHSSFKIDHDSGVPADNSLLKADFTVSGFVKPDSTRQILSLRMAKCATGEIVWAGEFGFGVEDLLGSFRQISMRVASSLAEGLEREMLETMRKSGNAGAYRFYLEGRDLQRQISLPKLRRARANFARATQADTRLGCAYARLAETLFDEWALLGGNDPQLLGESYSSAHLATTIDPNMAEGHWMTGLVMLYRREFDGAAEKFVEAESLSPNNADLLVEHANTLAHLGDAELALTKFERALELNPAPPDHYWRTGAGVHFTAHNFVAALDLCGRVSNDECVLRLLAACNALSGRLELAHEYGTRLKELYPDQNAKEMVGISPDRDTSVTAMFLEGLRMAGVP